MREPPEGTSAAAPPVDRPGLVRGLSAFDGALLTIGSVVGTGIFLTTSDIARVLPSEAWILAVWLASGLLTLAGALTYAELGAMFPRAGGMYVFLKEAYGPLPGFLYGWTAFTVIMSGGIAAIAVGFGEYLGSFLPFFSTGNQLLAVPLGSWTWSVSGGQLAAALAIVFLTAVNYLGLKEGAWLQNLLTLVKIASLLLIAGIGFLVPARAVSPFFAPVPGGGLLAAFAVGMIAALWTYDGWYGLTFSAGEMKNPSRGLPLGLIGGTIAVIALYLLINLAYFRALTPEEMAATSRIGETAAQSLFGSLGARLLAAAVLVSTFGCLSSTILYSSRTYLPMAEDGLFFRSLAEIHPRHRTPGKSLWWQTAWALVLTLSGTYSQLYTYVVFAAVLFHVATGAAVFVLRAKRPEVSRPYRVWGYPLVPAAFIVASLVLVGSTLFERPVESLLGLLCVALGFPVYLFWRRRAKSDGPTAAVDRA